jgi:hypothetical protein
MTPSKAAMAVLLVIGSPLAGAVGQLATQEPWIAPAESKKLDNPFPKVGDTAASAEVTDPWP